MKKNNVINLSFILLAISCSKTRTPESLVSRLDKHTEKQSVLERKLANSQDGQCLKDIFSVETLKAEIKELERKYRGARMVTGRWKHIDLSRLPVPQANFLSEFGTRLGDISNPNSIDYSMCDDVPCIYNRIYGKENHVAGYVHYLWYLKFGHMLSADNKVPDQASTYPGLFNGKGISLSNYLYNENELYGLWRLSHMLKPPHTNLSALRELQRVPRGEKYEDPKFSGACGLASSAGWITLTDQCLWFDYKNVDDGFFYSSIIHELSHHVDFQQGRGTNSLYRSHRPDYMAFTGLRLNEYVDATVGMVRKWEIIPGAKFVSDYAKTSPQENFADSIAAFRVEGNKAKSLMANDHFSFISQGYYDGKAFDSDAMIKDWLQDYSTGIENLVFKAVVDCHKEPGMDRSSYFSRNDFTSPVLPSVMSCMGVNAEAIASSTRAKIMIGEPDGCNIVNPPKQSFSLTPQANTWDTLSKSYLVNVFNKYLRELQNDKQYLTRINAFYQELSDRTIAQNAYLECLGNVGEEECYSVEINRKAAEKVSSLKVPPEKMQEMTEMYASYHSYESIKQYMKKNYQVIVSANRETIRLKALEVWDRCRSIQHNDDETPTGRLYTPAGGYLISSFYNCLNAQMPEALSDVVRSISIDGQRVQHPKEELILNDEVRPVFSSVLQSAYEREKSIEANEAVDLMAKDNGAIRAQMLSDFSWVTDVMRTDQIMADCKKKAYEMIPFWPLFHLKKDLFSDYLETRGCIGISNSSEFNNWIENSKDQFNTKLDKSVDVKMEELARARAEKCLAQYPMKTQTDKVRFRQQREECLLSEWPQMEAQVLTMIMSDPMTQKYNIPEATFRGKLETIRRRLQLRIIKEYFH